MSICTKPAPTKKSATRNDGIRHSSIVTDAQAIPTVAGPILGWKCCPENLPKPSDHGVLW